MDLRSILNRPESDTTARPPQRSASLAQPPVPPGYLQRQQSLPSYPHDYPPQAHSPYAQQPVYLREQSLSVSPKTVPNPIPRNSVPDIGYFPEQPYIGHPDLPPTSTPTHGHARENSVHSHTRDHSVHSHTRDHSVHSHTRNHSVHSQRSISIASPTLLNHREPLDVATHLHHSQFNNSSNITSSPVQSAQLYASQSLHAPHSPHSPHSPKQTRIMAATSRHPTQSPVESRPMISAAQQLSLSPIQTKAMRPPTTPGAAVMQTPPPQPRNITPAQPSPSPRSQVSVSAVPSATSSIKPSPATDSPKANNRKRSLESPVDQFQQKRLKRRQYNEPPPWARRVNHGQMKPMEKFVPFGPKLDVKRADEKMPKQPQSGKKEQERLQIQTQRLTSASETPETNGHAQPQSSRPWEVPTMSDMELSLDAVVPYSDLTRAVANFLYENVVRAPDIDVGHMEVEAKLGTIYLNDDQRISMPVTTECAVEDGVTRRFESKMTMEQHKALNNYLNTETTRSHGTKGRIPIKYEHLRQVDSFYACPQFFLDSLPDPVKQVLQRSRHAPRVRVTRDAKSGQVLATIVKIRVKDMEIYCPQEHFDCRISASLELDYPHPIEGLVDTNGRGDRTSRTKDRLSYKHQCISIDLTQVTPENGGEKSHELELELDEKTLKDQGMLASEGAPNNYEGLVGVFLNYVRAVNRACKV